MNRYINLSTHSYNSKSESVVSPEEIVEFAVNDGAKAVALTDLNSLYGFSEFSKAAKKHRDKGFKPIFGVQIFGINTDRNITPRKLTLLAQNRVGLKNIYHIISLGYFKKISEEKWPCVSFEDIRNNREGVLVGLECTKHDLYQIWTDDEEEHEGEKKHDLITGEYSIADYIELKPWEFYIEVLGELDDNLSNEIGTAEEIIKTLLTEVTVALKKANKYAVAANNSNCITQQDELCVNILHSEDTDIQTKAARFLTTEEILAEYSSLDSGLLVHYPDLTEEVVLDNTNAIADMIEDIDLTNNFAYPIMIEDAEQKLISTCEKSLNDKYGDNIPDIIRKRYESELINIIDNQFASYYILAAMLTEKSREFGYLHNLRGCAAGSFIVYLLGISETNPLPPHFYCPKCKKVEFVDANKYPSGFDLNNYRIEQKFCPICGEAFVGDGHNIPVEFFAGYDGDKTPDFDFNFASEIQQDIADCFGEIFGNDKVFYAGTRWTYTYEDAEILIDNYCKKNNVQICLDEKDIIKDRIANVFLTNRRHHAGIIVIPNGKDVYDFTPVGYETEYQLSKNMKPTTLIDYYDLKLDKFDIFGHTMFSKLKLMEDMTGVSAKSIDFREIDADSFFNSDSLLGLPFKNDFAGQSPDKAFPKRFSDLVKISGFAHGTNVWKNNGEDLAAKICDIRELIAHREDIMLTLINYGIERSTAFSLAEMVRKGRAIRDLSYEQETLLHEHGIPNWYIDSMKKIMYLFPKSHAVEYVTNYMRMIWYKIYHPVVFYAAVLSLDVEDSFDYSILVEGRQRVELELKKLNKERDLDHEFDYLNYEYLAETQKEVLELVLECFERGISFLPADINISDPTRFIPEGNSIRIPFNCPKQN